MSQETFTHNPLVKKEFNARELLGQKYAATFSIDSVSLQDILPGMPLNREEKYKLSFEDTKESYRKEYPGCTVMTSDEYEWDIAYRACMAGLTGGVYYGDDTLKDITGLAIEVVQNNTVEVTRNRRINGSHIYIHILTSSELQDEISRWYALGVTERTTGSVIERAAQERRVVFEEESDEYPLTPEGMKDYEFTINDTLNAFTTAADALNDTNLYGPDDIDEVTLMAAQQSGVSLANLPFNAREYLKDYVSNLLTYNLPDDRHDYDDDDDGDWEDE